MGNKLEWFVEPSKQTDEKLSGKPVIRVTGIGARWVLNERYGVAAEIPVVGSVLVGETSQWTNEVCGHTHISILCCQCSIYTAYLLIASLDTLLFHVGLNARVMCF